MMKPLSAGPLLVDQAYEAIKSSIHDLTFKPGDSLVESQLARQMETSKTPIREALMRLERTGLVENLPHRGYRVAALSEADVRSILDIRAVLEALAARMACEHATGEELEDLRELIAEIVEEKSRGNLFRMSELGHQFHTRVCAYSHDRRLVEMISILNEQFELVRKISANVTGRIPHSVEEHSAILEALLERDGERASLLMNEHLHSVRDDALRSPHVQSAVDSESAEPQ